MNGGQARFNNYGSVTISQGASFTCSNYLNSQTAQSGSTFARRSVAQSAGGSAVTIMNSGSLSGTVTNSGFFQATGIITGDFRNLGQIYVGNFSQNSVGLMRQLNISGTFDNTATVTITPVVTLKIGKFYFSCPKLANYNGILLEPKKADNGFKSGLIS